MNNVFLRNVTVAAAFAALAACSGDSGGGGTTEPPKPVPGVLTLNLTTPNADDRAIVLAVSGPEAVSNVEVANSSHVLHSRISGTTVKAAVFGNLSTGPVLRLSVPDVNKLASYTASIVEVSDQSNTIRTPNSGYSLTLVR